MRTALPVLTLVLLTLGAGVLTDAQSSPSVPGTVAASAQKPDPAPDVPELVKLQIENAVLKANALHAEYQTKMRALGDVITAHVASFEKAHPGWTIDTAALKAIPKPKASK